MRQLLWIDAHQLAILNNSPLSISNDLDCLLRSLLLHSNKVALESLRIDLLQLLLFLNNFVDAMPEFTHLRLQTIKYEHRIHRFDESLQQH